MHLFSSSTQLLHMLLSCIPYLPLLFVYFIMGCKIYIMRSVFIFMVSFLVPSYCMYLCLPLDIMRKCGLCCRPVSIRLSVCHVRVLYPHQWRGLRPSVWGQNRSETKKIGLGLGLGLKRCGLGLGLVHCGLGRPYGSCHAGHHTDLEGHSNFSSTVYSFSVLSLEHRYCEDQQWRSLN